MAKFDTQPPQTYKPGERLGVGAIARMSRNQIPEIVGGGDVQVKQVGKRITVTAKKRTGGSVGGVGVPRLVAALPAIGSGYDCVTWASSTYITGGTGDDQVWEVDGRVGQTAWTPRQFLTSKSGTP